MLRSQPKIAIIHDSLTHLGGAERVLFSLCQLFPQADVYSSVAAPKLLQQLRKICKGQIYFSKISRWPLALTQPSLYKPYIFHYWQQLNLDNYNLVISSSHSFCSNWVKVKNKHLSYMHTPAKFLYREFNEMTWLKKFPWQRLFSPYFNYLRKKDVAKVQKIDRLLCNSRQVAARIYRYYQRRAEVVYPPVNSKLFKQAGQQQRQKQLSSNKNYYVFFSRLVKQKGLGLAVQTFNQLPDRQLVVIGEGREKRTWQRRAEANIKFLGGLADQQTAKILAGAKALIYCAIDEDFGMVPVESMAAGTPVIAYDSGALRESIIPQQTGLLFRQYKVGKLRQTILDFEDRSWSQQACQLQAAKFAEKYFLRQMQCIVKELTR